MKTREDTEQGHHRPINKATMCDPQEEFIRSEPPNVMADIEHGDEVAAGFHEHCWEKTPDE